MLELLWGGYNQDTYTKYLVLFTCYLYQKNSFSSNMGYSDFIKANTASQTTKTVAYGNMVSCFQAKDIKNIYCFVIISINEKKYKISL